MERWSLRDLLFRNQHGGVWHGDRGYAPLGIQVEDLVLRCNILKRLSLAIHDVLESMKSLRCPHTLRTYKTLIPVSRTPRYATHSRPSSNRPRDIPNVIIPKPPRVKIGFIGLASGGIMKTDGLNGWWGTWRNVQTAGVVLGCTYPQSCADQYE